MSRRTAAVALALVCASACAAAPAAAPAPAAPVRPAPTFQARVQLSPPVVKLGEVVHYRAWVTGAATADLRIFSPVPSDGFTWGRFTTRHAGPPPGSHPTLARGWWRLGGGVDTLVTTGTFQVFRIGDVGVPGLAVDIDDGTGMARHRLPTGHVVVVPVIGAQDTSADLRPVRGPIGAPWWERVPWRWVALGLALIAAVVLVVVRLRGRSRAVVAAPASAPRRVRDPLAEGLAALAALRADGLPAAGRFAEHAFRLTLILRRFLESVEGTPRPGDTSRELVGHLERGRLAPADLERLAGLLSRWDRVKFARASTTAEEAAQAEGAVEAMMRRLGERPEGKAA